MRSRLLAGISLVALAFCLFSLPLLAHHGNAALDMQKKVELKGVVKEWLWQNPHSILRFDVKDESGRTVTWSAEINNPADMVERGWTAKSIKVGEEVTVTVNPTKNGKPIGRIVQVVLPDGKVLRTEYTTSRN